VKRSDIPDAHVVELARQWREGARRDPGKPGPGVVRALVAEGVPEKVALAKVEHMISRGLLECGISPYYAWPVSVAG
jgi:hypothetical protein